MRNVHQPFVYITMGLIGLLTKASAQVTPVIVPPYNPSKFQPCRNETDPTHPIIPCPAFDDNGSAGAAITAKIFLVLAIIAGAVAAAIIVGSIAHWTRRNFCLRPHAAVEPLAVTAKKDDVVVDIHVAPAPAAKTDPVVQPAPSIIPGMTSK